MFVVAASTAVLVSTLKPQPPAPQQPETAKSTAAEEDSARAKSESAESNDESARTEEADKVPEQDAHEVQLSGVPLSVGATVRTNPARLERLPDGVDEDGHYYGVPLENELGLTPDGQILAGIAQVCGPNVKCAAGAWLAVEAERCQRGVFVSGGCLGPNGELMRWNGMRWSIEAQKRNGEIAERESTPEGQVIAGATGISVDAIKKHGLPGGPCSFFRKPFGC
jgi:hypothetical protein